MEASDDDDDMNQQPANRKGGKKGQAARKPRSKPVAKPRGGKKPASARTKPAPIHAPSREEEEEEEETDSDEDEREVSEDLSDGNYSESMRLTKSMSILEPMEGNRKKRKLQQFVADNVDQETERSPRMNSTSFTADKRTKKESSIPIDQVLKKTLPAGQRPDDDNISSSSAENVQFKASP